MRVLLFMLLVGCASCATVDFIEEYEPDVRRMAPDRGSGGNVDMREGPEAYRHFVNVVRAPAFALVGAFTILGHLGGP